MKRIILIHIILLLMTMTVKASQWQEADSVGVDTVEQEPPRKLSLIRRIIRGFDRTDDRYIEPQHYVFTVMMQATHTYDYYTVKAGDKELQSITFAPDADLKVGPYFGWKWVFAGYTVDVRNVSPSRKKTDWDLSIYSSQIGVDLLYRRTGSDYKLRDANLGSGVDVRRIEGASFDGVKAEVTGVNLYYIFNHGRFSYPAAFAQSTCQKISCGSWMAGVGYTKNALDLDYEKLQDLISERLMTKQVKLDSAMMFKSVRYHDFNVSAGYAYNWVFAPQWLFCASAQAAVAYKKTSGNMADNSRGVIDFNRIHLNGIGRFALVFNNTQWYAGFSAIVRTNNFREQRFSTSNTFGSMNLYAGYNFGLKKKYRKKE